MAIIDAHDVPADQSGVRDRLHGDDDRADAPIRPVALVQEGGCGRAHLPRRAWSPGAGAIDYCEWLNGREGVPGVAACYARGGDRLAQPSRYPT